MPTRDEHLRQAEQNESLADGLRGRDPGWAITVLFYAAVHYVEAYLDWSYAVHGCQQHSVDHFDREQAMGKYFAHVGKHYRPMYRKSREARYRCVPFSAYDYDDLKSKRYGPFKADMLRLLQPPDRRK
jgi:hypothetical protein